MSPLDDEDAIALQQNPSRDGHFSSADHYVRGEREETSPSSANLFLEQESRSLSMESASDKLTHEVVQSPASVREYWDDDPPNRSTSTSTKKNLWPSGSPSTGPVPQELRRASMHASAPPHGRRAHFEPVHWPHVWQLLTAVAVCWPIGQFVPSPACFGLSLNLARVIIGVIGVFIGLVCGWVLLSSVGRRIYSAVLFSSLVHQEMALHELDNVAELGPGAALQLLKYRWLARPLRRSQRSYDKTPWTLYLIFFILIFWIAAEGSFLYGRTVILDSMAVLQTGEYHPIPVLGELSQADVDYAALVAPQFYSSTDWTVSSLASLDVPSTSTLPLPSNSSFQVIFTSPAPYLFSPSSVGPSASLWRQFQNSTSVGAIGEVEVVTDDALLGELAQGILNGGQAPVPVAVDWPVWGSRVACATVGEAGGAIVQPVEGGEEIYFVVSNETVSGLLEKVGADEGLLTSESFGNPPTGTPENLTQGVVAGPWMNDGIASNFNFTILDNGTSNGLGYTSIGFLLVRLNETAAPGGSFLTMINGSFGTIGVDGAVCATRISPYIVRAVDNDGIIALREILVEGPDLPSTSAKQLQALFNNSTVPLTSSGKQVVFSNAVQNTRNQLIKDNSRHGAYGANPSLVQMTIIDPTAKTPPVAYGTLSSERVAEVLASSNSRFLQWYLVGQGRVAGRAYVYESVAVAHVSAPWLAGLMCLILVCGLLGTFFVPRLPFNMPYRTIVPSHWLDTLANQVPREVVLHQREAAIGDLKVRYGR